LADFDQHRFAAQSLAGIVGIASLVAASTPRPGDVIDAQRIRDHEILNARLARMRSRLARRRVEAALTYIEASEELRRAVIYAENRKA
jgi:hypothetical protein